MKYVPRVFIKLADNLFNVNLLDIIVNLRSTEFLII